MRRVNDSVRVGGPPELAPADHLAIDEAMLLIADESPCSGADDGSDDHTIMPDTEFIRVWSFDRPTVVLGRSSKVDQEVDRGFCRDNGIPILRRCSGGASVVGGPGCLMYSVVMSFQKWPHLQKIDAAHDHVMAQVLHAARDQVPETELQGICDLTWQNRKCSGNSLRVTRRHVLYHGTILHDADLQLLARCLTGAPRQPDYRGGRPHGDFVTNVPIDPDAFTEQLISRFGVSGIAQASDWIHRIDQLRRDRYDLDAWHFRH